jgi:Mg2+ and Co2+ transporter CorA
VSIRIESLSGDSHMMRLYRAEKGALHEFEGASFQDALRSLLTGEHSHERIQTIPIGVIMTPKHIITVRIGAAFDGHELTSDLKRKPKMVHKEDVFLALIRKIHRDIERTIRPIERKIGSIQDSILTSRSSEIAHNAFALNNGLILLNTALLSNLNAISMVPRMRQIHMSR